MPPESIPDGLQFRGAPPDLGSAAGMSVARRLCAGAAAGRPNGDSRHHAHGRAGLLRGRPRPHAPPRRPGARRRALRAGHLPHAVYRPRAREPAHGPVPSAARAAGLPPSVHGRRGAHARRPPARPRLSHRRVPVLLRAGPEVRPSPGVRGLLVRLLAPAHGRDRSPHRARHPRVRAPRGRHRRRGAGLAGSDGEGEAADLRLGTPLRSPPPLRPGAAVRASPGRRRSPHRGTRPLLRGGFLRGRAGGASAGLAARHGPRGPHDRGGDRRSRRAPGGAREDAGHPLHPSRGGHGARPPHRAGAGTPRARGAGTGAPGGRVPHRARPAAGGRARGPGRAQPGAAPPGRGAGEHTCLQRDPLREVPGRRARGGGAGQPAGRSVQAAALPRAARAVRPRHRPGRAERRGGRAPGAGGRAGARAAAGPGASPGAGCAALPGGGGAGAAPRAPALARLRALNDLPIPPTPQGWGNRRRRISTSCRSITARRLGSAARESARTAVSSARTRSSCER